eukprot:scaffold10878_cov108-Skeletonema_dohrnii-CCMP3373.AAC.3
MQLREEEPTGLICVNAASMGMTGHTLTVRNADQDTQCSFIIITLTEVVCWREGEAFHDEGMYIFMSPVILA